MFLPFLNSIFTPPSPLQEDDDETGGNIGRRKEREGAVRGRSSEGKKQRGEGAARGRSSVGSSEADGGRRILFGW